MDIRWQPVICYFVLLMRKLRVREKTRLAQGPQPMSISSSGVRLVLGLYMVNSITISRLPEPLTSWPLFYMMSVPTQAQHTSCGPSRTDVSRALQEDQKFEQYIVLVRLCWQQLNWSSLYEGSVGSVQVQLKYEKNPKCFKQDRCLFLSQIQKVI